MRRPRRRPRARAQPRPRRRRRPRPRRSAKGSRLAKAPAKASGSRSGSAKASTLGEGLAPGEGLGLALGLSQGLGVGEGQGFGARRRPWRAPAIARRGAGRDKGKGKGKGKRRGAARLIAVVRQSHFERAESALSGPTCLLFVSSTRPLPIYQARPKTPRQSWKFGEKFCRAVNMLHLGIPFAAPEGRGTPVWWTPLDTPSLDLITRARFRRWTNASVTTRPAASPSVVCAGLRDSPAPIAERRAAVSGLPQTDIADRRGDLRGYP